MSFIDVASSILNLEPPKPTLQLVVIASAENLHELPKGFFNVETASGKKSLGWNGTFYCYEVGETVNDYGKRITLDKPRSELPTVKLDFRRDSQTVMGHGVIETDAEDYDPVSWAGDPPSSGVQWR